MSSDKTEQPTGKRLQDARKKGQVVRSKELAIAAATVAGTMALGRLGGTLLHGLGDRLAADLTHLGDAPFRDVSSGDVVSLVIGAGRTMVTLVGPIAMTTMIVGVAMQGAQGGWNIASDALTLNFGKLNPASGFKRLGFKQGGVDTLKTFVSVAMIATVAWLIITPAMDEGLKLPWMTPADAALAFWTEADLLLWRVAWGLGFLAIGDYGLQRYRLYESLKMTKQEVKDEAKQQENQEIKGRVRKVQREMAKKRMLGNVRRATVVITNPTHFAVALEYRRGEMAAPVVLAKGADHVAAAIRQRAREHGVPLVENKPLAQALFKTAEIGEAIPGPLFSAVAEVLAQLIRLKQLVM